MKQGFVAFILCACLYAPSVAASSTFVISAGNNVGNDGDFPLRFAEEDAIQFANIAANVVIEKIGTAVASLDEIQAFETSHHKSEKNA